MGTYTAQILTGHGHQNHDGVNPVTHQLFLSENSRPSWTIYSSSIGAPTEKQESIATWVPTVENMLEDALVMVAIYVSQNHEVRSVAKEKLKNGITSRVELYEESTEEGRRALYASCRKLDRTEYPKLIVTPFDFSTILRQLEVLRNYRMDVEVCAPIYYRLYSAWTKEVRESGDLSVKEL